MQAPLSMIQFIRMAEREAERQGWRSPLADVARGLAAQMGVNLPTRWRLEIEARALVLRAVEVA